MERRLVEALQRLAERPDDAGRVSLGRGLEAVRGRGVLRIRAVAAAHACSPAVVSGGALAAPSAGRRDGRLLRLRLAPFRLLLGAAFDREAALAGEAFAGCPWRLGA